MNRRIVVAADPCDLSQKASSYIAEAARCAIDNRGRFTMTLSGGSSPRETYERLAERRDIDWPRVYLFPGDERFVEPSNPYSNQGLFESALLSRVPSFPLSNFFPVPVDAANPTQGARLYSETIRRFFDVGEGAWPKFDLVLLGLGPDGHTASLFPRFPRDRAPAPIARMAHAGHAPWVDRVTLTFATFNHARQVLFLAEGSQKAAMLKSVLEDPPNDKHRPAQGIRPQKGSVTWIVDAAIAAGLSAETLAGRDGPASE